MKLDVAPLSDFDGIVSIDSALGRIFPNREGGDAVWLEQIFAGQKIPGQYLCYVPLPHVRSARSALPPIDHTTVHTLSAMESHHAASIRNLVAEFEHNPSVLALLLGGSLAHGFARSDSDIDVAIVLNTAEFQRRKQTGKLHYNNRTLCTYEGYIDGKYMDWEFLRQVAARGSEPARYAFKDSRILFSRIEGLDQLLAEIVRYPVEGVNHRIAGFVAQLLAWRWYYSEGVRQESPYLICLALQKITLFSCRIVLAKNALLYPYHKWMLRVAESAPKRPPGFPDDIRQLLAQHSWQQIDDYCRGIVRFAGMEFSEADAAWPSRFMQDTELKWMTAEPHIDDW